MDGYISNVFLLRYHGCPFMGSNSGERAETGGNTRCWHGECSRNLSYELSSYTPPMPFLFFSNYYGFFINIRQRLYDHALFLLVSRLAGYFLSFIARYL